MEAQRGRIVICGNFQEVHPDEIWPSMSRNFLVLSGRHRLLRARIARDADGTVWCDRYEYIFHCLRENGFMEPMDVCL